MYSNILVWIFSSSKLEILAVPENFPVTLKYINVNSKYFLIYLKVFSFTIKAHLTGMNIFKISCIYMIGGRKAIFSFNFLKQIFLLICLIHLSP